MRHLICALLLGCAPHPAPVAPPVDPLAERPEVGPVPDFSVSPPQTQQLENGCQLWTLPSSGLPLVSLRLVLPGGSAIDPPDQAGQTALADTLLLHGAGSLDASAFAATTERYAIDFNVSTRSSHTTIAIDTHTDQLERALSLLADVVLQPRFDPAELDRVREIRLGELAISNNNISTTAARIARRVYLGETHPHAHPVDGTPAGLAEIEPADLQASWDLRAQPARATFIVAGAIDPAALQEALTTHFSDWASAEPLPPLPEIPPPAGVTDGPRLYLADHPGATQTVLRVVLPGWSSQADMAQAGQLGTIVLGGTFTSRLNQLLREEKGYTYGARARAQQLSEYGLLHVSTSVQREVTQPALQDLLSEIARLPEGISAAEHTKATGAYRTSIIESFGGQASIASLHAIQAALGLPAQALQLELEQLSQIDEPAVEAALQSLALSQAAIVVVGDLSAIQSDLEQTMPGDWVVTTP